MRHGCGGSLGAEPRPGQEDPRAAHQARPRPLPATRAAAAGGMRSLGLAGLHGAGGVHLHVAGRARIIRLQHPDARPRTRRRRCACMLTCWRRASRRITTRPRSSSRRVPRSRPREKGVNCRGTCRTASSAFTASVAMLLWLAACSTKWTPRRPRHPGARSYRRPREPGCGPSASTRSA
jgi:hypothetical protein